MVGLAQQILKEANNIFSIAKLYSIYVSYLFLLAANEGKKLGIVQIIHTLLCFLSILVGWESRSLTFLLPSLLLSFLSSLPLFYQPYHFMHGGAIQG